MCDLNTPEPHVGYRLLSLTTSPVTSNTCTIMPPRSAMKSRARGATGQSGGRKVRLDRSDRPARCPPYSLPGERSAPQPAPAEEMEVDKDEVEDSSGSSASYEYHDYVRRLMSTPVPHSFPPVLLLLSLRRRPCEL